MGFLKKIFIKEKEGGRLSSFFLILIYICAVLLDIYTTYIASPDLKHEGNIVIKYFNLEWKGLIVLNILYILSTILIYYFSTNYIKRNVRQFNKKKFYIILALTGTTIFYCHFITSIMWSINNYFSYIYLLKIENLFTNISLKYINDISNIPNFYLVLHFLAIILSVIISIVHLKFHETTVGVDIPIK